MDFRGIVLSEGFSWPTPLCLRAEEGRSQLQRTPGAGQIIKQTRSNQPKMVISDQLSHLFVQI
jgi:hypothetical protein